MAFTPERGKESAALTAPRLQMGRGGERWTGSSAIGAGAPRKPRIGCCGQQSGSWCLSRARWEPVVGPPRLGKSPAATWSGLEVSAHVQECEACVGSCPWLCELSHLSILPTLRALGFNLGHPGMVPLSVQCWEARRTFWKKRLRV